MAVNDLTFNQVSTLLNSIVEQATGESVITPTDESEFVTVAQVGLKAGYDPLLSAISQVLSRTIFSNRPYGAKFTAMQMDNQQFGAITRKLQIVDKDWQNDVKFVLTDGQSVDHYEVNKPEVLQTNFYGANVFSDSVTIPTEQLDNAFSGSEQFGEFISMVTQNMQDRIEQAKENLARATLGNFIAGKSSASNNVYHLLTEYNTATGLSLTATTVKQPANWKGFVQWAYARIGTLSEMMTERSSVYHINVTGKVVQRHSPQQDQVKYFATDFLNAVDSMVLADTYNDSYLKVGPVEKVNFWQSISTPGQIQATPVYLDTDGTLTSPNASVTVSDILGVIIDREALGYTVVKETVATTPLNAKGLYYNMFWHFTLRYYNDFMENGVIFLLD